MCMCVCIHINILSFFSFCGNIDNKSMNFHGMYTSGYLKTKILNKIKFIMTQTFSIKWDMEKQCLKILCLWKTLLIEAYPLQDFYEFLKFIIHIGFFLYRSITIRRSISMYVSVFLLVYVCTCAIFVIRAWPTTL